MRLLKLVPDTTNIQFLKWRNVAIIISIILTVASITLTATRGLNFGVDFAGGQMIQATFTEDAEAPVVQLREDIAGLGIEGASIQRFGDENQVSIRMRVTEGADDDPEIANQVSTQVTQMMQANYEGVRIDSVDSVSGKVSDELFRAGALALGLAMVAISLYIWLRFEWQFGVGALFALFHDVALTFGFFALTQLEFNLNIVAALLTIIGYSLNDTIVVYDRIRENLRKYRKMEIVPLLDLSVNETLARTVMTSLTMVFALVVLIWVGPDLLFGFTAAMLLGIFIGTYSSVYMAAPILIWLKVGPDTFVPEEASGGQKIHKEGYGR
ncbi:protein translocase subunit SecF [Parasphingopyxis algicola]|uniref:protein translocase subunit SecF n=1 Tax=Parasphingopyxis algicola TaxID=2026624 RepID=UPI0015A1B213|nr:protein translocase subunit SecF [Parasphingopyxis algicola]QLC25142.1 protein translocase subunit SecF [Parasphingopyxis algicola]